MIMISANSWPYLLPNHNCPHFLRLIFSTAAPIFIFLSGISISINISSGKRNNSILKRAFQVLCFAVFIDTLIWNIGPFYTMDVLYLIAFSNILIVLFIRYLPTVIQLIGAFLVLLTCLVTNNIYEFELNEISLTHITTEYSVAVSLKQVILDGWFPLIPWIGIAMLGFITYNERNLFRRYSKFLLVSGIAIISTYYLFSLFNTFQNEPYRNGYTELFYPVDLYILGYFTAVFSVIIFFYDNNFNGFRIIQIVGTLSLPIYLLHIILIKYYLPLFESSSVNLYPYLQIFTMILFYFIIIVTALTLSKYLPNIKSRKFITIRFIMGL